MKKHEGSCENTIKLNKIMSFLRMQNNSYNIV